MRKQKISKFTLKNVIFNEEEEAKTVLKTGKINKKPSLTLRPVIKYLHSLGKNKEQIRQDVEEFMSENFPEYISSKWSDILDGLVNTYTKDGVKMIKIDSINITEKELEYISSLNDIKLEKLAFVILVYYKVKSQMSNKTSSEAWINFNNSEIFREAKIRLRIIDQSLMLHKLKNTGAIEISKSVSNESVKINYINEESPSLIQISDFREIVLNYLRWKGVARIGVCEHCAKLIELKSNKTTYCNQCKKDTEKERKLKCWNKNKEKYRKNELLDE